jgi:hypothetical protein
MHDRQRPVHDQEREGRTVMVAMQDVAPAPATGAVYAPAPQPHVAEAAPYAVPAYGAPMSDVAMAAPIDTYIEPPTSSAMVRAFTRLLLTNITIVNLLWPYPSLPPPLTPISSQAAPPAYDVPPPSYGNFASSDKA